MRFWNHDDIESVVRRASNVDALARHAAILRRFVGIVESNSDGWIYWPPACAAADGLVTLLERWSREPWAMPAKPAPMLNRATGRIRALCTKHRLQDPTGLDNAGITALIDAMVLVSARDRGVTLHYTLHPAPAAGDAHMRALPTGCAQAVVRAVAALLEIERYDTGALRGTVATSRGIETSGHAALAAHRRLRDWAGRDSKKRAVLALVPEPPPA